MPSTDEIRKTITDPTPLYFAAGVIEKVRTEAPERIAKIRSTDPKIVQERVQGALATLDADLKKLREQAQHLALQGIGYAAEAAVKAKEGYDSLAEQGKVAVEGWRAKGDDADPTYEATIEREPVTVTEPVAEGEGAKAEDKAESKAEAKGAAGRKPAARKTTARRSTAKSED
ncbi:hypothetical protein [Streptomyces alkaliterrae]|uniref:Uncharacterized protein n=1 Tax=Streptomyces alkaliterrae TaxID=2213162 RepID=A0A5P0YTT8_9ACTN|nr:hypothetical protein [Streptomyces alkaliterrae]MBB1253999.1 hypothetical protein [Streptomyces alkaliterrae]MBB1259233.1 hypothetical protein [Streptomyces alkaliterrae]MQS03715.1 hypothetical protein [Streptomyces alkaliterrae]